jgi:prophage DNA circulation protein
VSQISDHRNPWRDILLSQPASFAGVVFHVEQGGRTSGRRTVDHQYPKRDPNYAEDMGRQSIRFNLSAYLIYSPNNPMYEYTSQRKALYEALEKEGADTLVHPVFAPGGIKVMCERYTMTESRERGGYTQFEMQFVDAGTPVLAAGVPNTSSIVQSRATAVENVWTSGTSPLAGLTQRSVLG